MLDVCDFVSYYPTQKAPCVSPLVLACRNRHGGVVDVLLSSGVDTDQLSRVSPTCFCAAVSVEANSTWEAK